MSNVVLKAGVLSFKTLAVQLKLQKKGESVVHDLAGRGVDVTDYVCQALNVSQAILNNVLFCHQENSSWPLDEGQKLKQRFDEIFDAVKYNKCVETLRKQIKARGEDIKLKKVELKSKEENKDRVHSLESKVKDRERQLADIENEVEQKKEDLVPIENRIREIWELEETLSALQRQLATKEEQRKGLSDFQATLKKSISFVFEGTDEELQAKKESFAKEKENDERLIDEILKRKVIIEEKVIELRRVIQKLQVNIGQIKEEERQNTLRIEERDNLIDKAINQFQIENPEKDNRDVIINKFKSALATNQELLDDLVMDKEMEEVELQKKIDDLLASHSRTKQEISSKNTLIRQCQDKIKECENKLKDLTVKRTMLTKVSEDVEKVQNSLLAMNDTAYEAKVNKEINDASDEIVILERKREMLESEYRILQQNHVTEEMIEKETESIAQKKLQLNILKGKHQEALFNLCQEDVPDADLHNEISQILKRDDSIVKNLNDKITKLQKRITTLEIEIKNKRSDIQKNELNLADKEKQLHELCNGVELDDMLNKTETEKENWQKEKGKYRYVKLVYESYIQKFESESPSCPICSTDFTKKEGMIKKIITYLKGKIQDVPTKLEHAQNKLKTSENLYNKLQQLKPTSNEIMRLKTRVLPELRKELDQFTEELEKLTSDLKETKAQIEEPQKNVELCRNIMSDVIKIEQYDADITKSEKSIEDLKEKIVSVDSERTRQETEAEMDDVNAKLSNLRHVCETSKRALDKHRKRYNDLRQEKDRLVEKKMSLQASTQEIPLTEKQLDQYKETLNATSEEVQTLNETEKTLNADLIDIREKKAILSKNNKQLISEESNKVQVQKRLIEDIEKLQKSIQEYMEKNNNAKLQTAEGELDQISSKENDLIQTKTKLLDAVSKKKENLAKRESNYRALEDNVLLRKKHAEEETVKTEIEELRGNIGGHNYKSVDEEKQRLLKKRDLINREINNVHGRKEELSRTLKEFKAELNKPANKNAYKDYKKKYYELTIAEMLQEDMTKYTVALEKSILQFHKDRMKHINKIIRELWRAIYRGNDIDYIEIQTEDAVGTNVKRRSYSYKVVQVKKGVEIEMRGRCSAGQRVLACLVIRMALAETFSSHCGILALDEPTTNLDRQNILSLSDALVNLIENRKNEKNFQLLIITHDEDFLNTLTRVQTTPHYWKVSRNEDGFSIIRKVTT